MKLKITIDQRTYEVDVEPSEPEPAAVPPPRGYVVEPSPMLVPAGAATAMRPAPAGTMNEDKVCRSPVSGTVVRILAQPGQSLQVGDVLLVLEAMKMETNITAPVAGKVATIKVNAGDAVQSGQVVVELE